eukprot:CAMPEP_0176422966 /NCGR_PEP_ID=MMETSP0127-20121128/10022_1 /TAXON_ID=938130 /ORGANISM="Platyophrya macrostoma, Strain WH" /LENGTH=129 /DNA_ID=CAMNT_0017803865 /DNA_START=285 /DNA_END=674 /DNA_ORIENTATION=-
MKERAKSYISENNILVTCLPKDSNTKSNNNKLNLKGAWIGQAKGLSEELISLFKLQGSYESFSEAVMNELVLCNPNATKEVNLQASGLNAEGFDIIGKRMKWFNIEKLDLKQNELGDKEFVRLAGFGRT